MKMRKLGGLILACAALIGSTGVSAASSEEALMEELLAARTVGSVKFAVSAGASACADNSLTLEAGETVNINCPFSPLRARLDFGLIAPDGTFYYKSATGGTINFTIEVPEDGDYTFAVRNRSSDDVWVLGFVTY